MQIRRKKPREVPWQPSEPSVSSAQARGGRRWHNPPASPHAVSSREFVERFEAGEVVDLDVSRWVEAVLRGLDDRSLWEWRHVARDRAAGWLSLDGAVTALDGAVMSVLDADVAGARAESRTAL